MGRKERIFSRARTDDGRRRWESNAHDAGRSVRAEHFFCYTRQWLHFETPKCTKLNRISIRKVFSGSWFFHSPTNPSKLHDRRGERIGSRLSVGLSENCFLSGWHISGERSFYVVPQVKRKFILYISISFWPLILSCVLAGTHSCLFSWPKTRTISHIFFAESRGR